MQVLSPQITSFAKLVGQSFEVQSIIALVNTILTTLGLVALKIPGYGFLSLVVLITSFIPVFGETAVCLSVGPRVSSPLTGKHANKTIRRLPLHLPHGKHEE